MSLLRALTLGESIPAIESGNLVLRAPQMGDYEGWAALREQSRAFLVPWEPIWPPDDLTRGAFRRRIKRYQGDMRADVSYAFFVLARSDEQLLGGLTLGQIRRGVAQCASLGYWMGAPYAGRGVMTAAVRAVLPFAFDALKLRRVEAACIPTNQASMRLLEKVGFRREGYAREYLCINGQWQDHVLFGCLRSDMGGAAIGNRTALDVG